MTPTAFQPLPEHFLLEHLDWPAMLALLERLAKSPLARAAVRALAPRGDEAARAALARQREWLALDAQGARPPSAGLHDVPGEVGAARASHRPLERIELLHVREFARASAEVAAWIAARATRGGALAELGVRLPDLTEIGDLLARSLDEDGEFQDAASPALARLRREERSLSAEVKSALAAFLQRGELKAALADLSVHLRAGRLVVAVKARSSSRVAGIVHNRSQSGETLFIEPREVVEAQNRAAAVRLERASEEHRLQVELSRAVHAHASALEAAGAELAEVELGRVGAELARRLGARVPELAEASGGPAGSRPGLVLRGARHPLLEEERLQGRLSEVVPIDVRLGEEFDLLVITGPNTGGKTLALKTVAMAAILVRLGLPVCCSEGSRVPLYDGLVADLGDAQELGEGLSTFAAHVARIREGLSRATPRTLVLLDELGTGTDPDEGAALGAAVLEHLLDRGAPTMVTTHIGKLKEFAFARTRAENASVEFDPQTFRPRYRLLVGTPGESNALHVARALGLDESIVASARRRLERRDAELLALFAQVRGAREEAERLRGRAETTLADLSRQSEHVETRAQDLERKIAQVEHEAQRALEARVAAARAHLAAARSLLPQVPRTVAQALAERLEAAEADLAGASLSERRAAFLAGLKSGDYVWLPRYRKRCLVLRLLRKSGTVQVQLGPAALEVALDEVRQGEAE